MGDRDSPTRTEAEPRHIDGIEHTCLMMQQQRTTDGQRWAISTNESQYATVKTANQRRLYRPRTGGRPGRGGQGASIDRRTESRPSSPSRRPIRPKLIADTRIERGTHGSRTLGRSGLITPFGLLKEPCDLSTRCESPRGQRGYSQQQAGRD